MPKSTYIQSMELFAEMSNDHFMIFSTLNLAKASFDAAHTEPSLLGRQALSFGVLPTAWRLDSVLKCDAIMLLNIFFGKNIWPYCFYLPHGTKLEVYYKITLSFLNYCMCGEGCSHKEVSGHSELIQVIKMIYNPFQTQ